MRDKKGRFVKNHSNLNTKLKGCFRDGSTPWNKGKRGLFKMSDKAKSKLSLSIQKTKPWESLKGKPAWNRGKQMFSKDENHPRYGNERITVSGYIQVFRPNHPSATKQGYVMKHRLVCEDHLGRILKPEEVVHHINGNCWDNWLENLKLFENNSSHMKKHWAGWVHELPYSKRKQVI